MWIGSVQLDAIPPIQRSTYEVGEGHPAIKILIRSNVNVWTIDLVLIYGEFGMNIDSLFDLVLGKWMKMNEHHFLS